MQQCINKMILNDDKSDKYEVKHKEGLETNKTVRRLFAVCIGLPNLNSIQIVKNHVQCLQEKESTCKAPFLKERCC